MRAVGEAKVVDGDGGLGGDGGDEVFAGGGEVVDGGVAVDEAAEALAGAAADGGRKDSCERQGDWGRGGEGKVAGEARVEGDVGRANDELVEKAVCGDFGAVRLRKGGEDVEVGASFLVEAVRLIVVADVVVEEGAVAGAAEMQAGIESCLDDHVEGTLRGEQNACLNQEPETLFVL